MSRIMVLNDGETYTSLAGCRIVEIDDNIETDDIEPALKDMFHRGEPVDGFQVVEYWDENEDHHKLEDELDG